MAASDSVIPRDINFPPDREVNETAVYVYAVEWCTTSYVYYDVTADEEPLLCPSGYTCFIDDPGDINNGVPNRGRCVPESTGLSSGKNVSTVQ